MAITVHNTHTVNPFPSSKRLGGFYNMFMAMVVMLASVLPLLTLYPGVSLGHFLVAAFLTFIGLGIAVVYIIRSIIEATNDLSNLIRVHRAIKKGE